MTQYPVVTITGSRQSGKITLVRETYSEKTSINLEEPDTREIILADPRKLIGDRFGMDFFSIYGRKRTRSSGLSGSQLQTHC